MRKAHLPYKGGGFCFETQNKKIQVIVIVCGNCNGILYDSCCCIGGRRRGNRKITNSQELIDAINNQKDGQTWELAAGTYDVGNGCL